MKDAISVRAEAPRPERVQEYDVDECYPESLVEQFLEEYTSAGDVVLDPFAGAGTTLIVTERMGRRPLGLEIQAERVDFIRRYLRDPAVVRHADTLRISELDLPRIDFSITSPPYMTRTDHPWNPLTGYRTLDADYDRYLVHLAQCYRQIGTLLAPGARAVLNVANIEIDGRVTNLADDVATSLSDVLTLEQDVLVEWDSPLEWCLSDHCLVFRRPE